MSEGGEPRRQHQMRGGARHAEPEIAGRPVARLDRRFQRQVDLGERRPQPLQQLRALLGRRDAARAAREQPHAKPRLEARHRMTDRRRRDAELARGATEAGALSDGGEHRELREVHSIH